jgi:DnaJ-class molecular chaperone
LDDPWKVLGLAAGASDETIRRRYLELVRAHPPERDPRRFAEVRSAYDALRDPASRLQRSIFEMATDYGIDDVLAAAYTHVERKRFATDLLLSLGRK